MQELTEFNLEKTTAEILMLKDQTAQNIIEIGKRLIQAKDNLQHGEFMQWLENKVDFSRHTANRFMKIATEFSNVPSVQHLGTRKLFALAGLNEEDRKEVMQENNVEDMTTRELEQVVREKKQIKEQLEPEKEVVKKVIPEETIKKMTLKSKQTDGYKYQEVSEIGKDVGYFLDKCSKYTYFGKEYQKLSWQHRNIVENSVKKVEQWVEKMRQALEFKEDISENLIYIEGGKKRVYITSGKARTLQEKVKEKVKIICEENSLSYHKYKSKIFPRVWTKIKAKYDVANYRELPEMYWKETLEYLRDMTVNVKDLQDEIS